MKITNNILLNNGFTIYDEKNDFIKDIYVKEGWKKYIIIKNNFHIEVTSDLSNYIGRNWNVRVDNCDFNTVGSLDIETIEQFNLFMECLEINFKIE